jgi:hypothetical protein
MSGICVLRPACGLLRSHDTLLEAEHVGTQGVLSAGGGALQSGVLRGVARLRKPSVQARMAWSARRWLLPSQRSRPK